MSSSNPLRRAASAVVLTALACAGVVVAQAPAAADPPEVALSASAATVTPGSTLTVTETVHNIHGFSIIQPTVRLFSSPTPLSAYTTLTACDAGAGGSCTTVADPNGGFGYEGVLGQAISGYQSATVTFTLTIAANAPGGQETLAGQLFGVNYGTPQVPGPVVTVDANADVAVRLTGAPRFGLLVPQVDFTVTVTNLGPDPLVGATVTGTLPAGLSASSTDCAAGATVVCTFGGLPKGGTASARFSVPLGLLSIGLPYHFTATRTASTPNDPQPANDTARTTCTVLSIVLTSCTNGTQQRPVILNRARQHPPVADPRREHPRQEPTR